jgi:hypothetical protein
MTTQQLRTRRFVLMTLACVLVAFTVPAPAEHRGVKFKEVTFTDSSTPDFDVQCPLVQGDLIWDRVDAGTVEGELQGTITACLMFTSTPGLVPQASGPFEIKTDDVTWTGNFQAFATSGFLATGEYFGDGTDGTKLRGTFAQFQIGVGELRDRFLNRAIIITPPSP